MSDNEPKGDMEADENDSEPSFSRRNFWTSRYWRSSACSASYLFPKRRGESNIKECTLNHNSTI